MICKPTHDFPVSFMEKLKFSAKYSSTMEDEFYDIIKNLSLTSDMIYSCSYRNFDKTCVSDGSNVTSAIFDPIMTDKGMCMTFNMQNRSDMFREDV